MDLLTAVQQAENELETKKELLRLSKHSADYKKEGNGWLIFTLLLILAEICLVILGNGFLGIINIGFSFLDVVIIGIPLIITIKKKISGLSAYKKAQEQLRGVDMNKLPREIEELERKISNLDFEFDDESEEEFDLSNVDLDDKSWMTVYVGKNWDLKNFTATPENIRNLEIDAENLLVSIQYTRGSKQIVDNWLCNNRMQLLTARLSQNSSLESALDRGFEELGKSGSWKLKTLQLVIASFDLTLLHIGLGAEKPFSFVELTDRTEGYRAPETQDEKEFYNAAMLGSITINSSVEYVLKS